MVKYMNTVQNTKRDLPTGFNPNCINKLRIIITCNSVGYSKKPPAFHLESEYFYILQDYKLVFVDHCGNFTDTTIFMQNLIQISSL